MVVWLSVEWQGIVQRILLSVSVSESVLGKAGIDAFPACRGSIYRCQFVMTEGVVRYANRTASGEILRPACGAPRRKH